MYFYTRINQLHGLHGLFEKKTKQQQYIVYAFNIIFIKVFQKLSYQKAQCMRYQTYQFFLLKVRYVNREGKKDIVIAYREITLLPMLLQTNSNRVISLLWSCTSLVCSNVNLIVLLLIITNIFNIVYHNFPWRYYSCLFDHD